VSVLRTASCSGTTDPVELQRALNPRRGATHPHPMGGVRSGRGSSLVASRFVKTERGDETEAILAALARLEAEVAELRKHQVPSPGPRTP
jgi:hypothetical protein